MNYTAHMLQIFLYSKTKQNKTKHNPVQDHNGKHIGNLLVHQANDYYVQNSYQPKVLLLNLDNIK